MIYEWDRPLILTSRLGTFELNPLVPSGNHWKIVRNKSEVVPTLRTNKAPMPRKHGSQLRRRFWEGLTATITVEAWDEAGEDPVCGEALTEMMDDLRAHLWALAVDTVDLGRLSWQLSGPVPSGLSNAARMLDDIRLASVSDEFVDDKRTQLTFVVDSPFPYLMNEEQFTQTIDGSGTITMLGTADFYPVAQYSGVGTGFIYHADLDQVIEYDDTRPGAPGSGTYIEFDFYRETAFVNGDGADAMPGVKIETSDFFPLLPGANDIETSGPVTFLLNHAWA